MGTHLSRLFQSSTRWEQNVLGFAVFFESDNYHSFNRVINAWSFRRKSTGPDRGSYFHELFLRGKPHLQKYMRRLPRTHKKLAMSKSEEPDFFELAKTSPLPTLEQARLNLESRKYMRLRQQLEKEGGSQGGLSDRKRPPHANGSNDKHTPGQQNMQAKDQGNVNGVSPIGFQPGGQQSKYLTNRGITAQNAINLPDKLFRIQQQQDDQLIKDEIGLQQRMLDHALEQHPQQKALSVHNQSEAIMMRQQQEQQMLVRHRAQMMQRMEQEQQFIRAQSMRQAELAAHQQQNQMNLLRQMDFFQNQQRNGF